MKASLRTLSLVATLALALLPFVATAQAQAPAYIGNTSEDSISVVDTATNTIIATYSAVPSPAG